MGPLAQFLKAAASLASRGIKKEDILKFAKAQFGEVTEMLKKQIDDIYTKLNKPKVGKSTKKEGEVIPFKKKEGIMATEEASPLMKRLDDVVDMLQKNPKRPGGSLDPATGLTRTAARQILQKLAREGKINIPDEREREAIVKGFQGGVDPIEVFRKTFGQDVLGDVANLSEELLEIERRGGSYKELNKVLEDAGFFDLKQPKNPPQGMTDAELSEFIKKTDAETAASKTEQTDLEQLEGLGATKLAERFRLKKKYPGIDDELLTNIIDDPDPQHKAEVLGQLDQAFEMMNQGKSPDEIQDIFERLKNTRKDNATGGRVQLADGNLNPALMKRMMELMMNPEYRGMSRDQLKKEAESQLMQDSYRSKEGPLLEAKAGGRVRAAGGGLADILKV